MTISVPIQSIESYFNLTTVHSSWKPILLTAFSKMDPRYLANLNASTAWLPGPEYIFNAFSLAVDQVNYVLFGESPYPRASSANGYAFWDAAVTELWTETGLSKRANRATSFRNILKMLLIAEGLLTPEITTQEEITKIDKKYLVQTNNELFANLLKHGFLLLNATLVLSAESRSKEAKAWQPFIYFILHTLLQQRPHVKLILFGNIAHNIDALTHDLTIEKLYVEHPYNVSFVTNEKIRTFFKPLHVLSR